MVDHIKEITTLCKGIAYLDIMLLVLLYVTKTLDLATVYGIFFGILISIVNFLALVKSSQVAFSKSAAKAKNIITISYFVRYFFVLIMVSIAFLRTDINQWMVVLHLLYPKAIFTVKILMRKEG